jgi:hypothetical protein
VHESKVFYHCSVCGQLVFTGRAYEYEYPPGSHNYRSEIEGEYVYGAGECRACGKDYCEDCGKFDGNVCVNCKEEAEL